MVGSGVIFCGGGSSNVIPTKVKFGWGCVGVVTIEMPPADAIMVIPPLTTYSGHQELTQKNKISKVHFFVRHPVYIYIYIDIYMQLICNLNIIQMQFRCNLDAI